MRSRRSLLSASAAAGIAAVGFAIPARCAGKIFPGTSIAGIDVGGMKAIQAESVLHEAFRSWEEHAVTFSSGSFTRSASLAELGYTIDYDATVAAALSAGRDTGFANRYASWFDPQSTAVSIVLRSTPETLDTLLSGIADSIEHPAIDATLSLTDMGEVVIHPEHPGISLDRQQAIADVTGILATFRHGTVNLAVHPVIPEISAIDLEDRRTAITQLIDQPVIVVSGEQQWTIETNQLIAALHLPEPDAGSQPTLDPDLLVESLQSIADVLATSPQDAIVGWNTGLYIIEDGTDGIAVDLPELARRVSDAAATESRQANVPLLPVVPRIHRDNLDTLGITTKLGSGSSSFAGSDDARAANLRTGAMWVDQTLIPPGESFSFNRELGPISLDRGYVEGKIISGDWYTSDIGGGVCQVSTTVYRAALFAGLPFAEWHPHSFRLGFYELEGWPPGMDAAIYVPNSPDEGELDLVFTNPTGNWLLLQLDLDGERLIASIYGPETGTTVDISDPVIGDPIAPPAPEERQSDNLAAGERKLSQSEKPGYEVWVRRVVTRDEATLLDATFYSYYAPQAEIWLLGTGSDSA